MFGDDDIIEPETPDVSETGEDEEFEVEEFAGDLEPKTTRRAKLRRLSRIGGLVLVLGVGSAGGISAYKYFKSSQSKPAQLALADFEEKLLVLEKSVAVQTSRADRLETQVKKISKDLTNNVTEIEAKWSQDLSELEALISSGAVKDTPLTDAPLIDSTEVNIDGETPRDGLGATRTTPDINPQILAAAENIRREFKQDITEIKRRIETLEAVHDEADAVDHTSLIRFPIETFTAQLEGDVLPVESGSRLGKFLKKHVSVNRTGHAEAVALLQRIEAEVMSGDWDAALSLANDLPSDARMAVEEWIAGARP